MLGRAMPAPCPRSSPARRAQAGCSKALRNGCRRSPPAAANHAVTRLAIATTSRKGWPARTPAPQQGDGEDGNQRERGGRAIPGVGVFGVGHHALCELAWQALHAQAQSLPDLAEGDADRDAGGEAGDHRFGHTAHERAQAQKARRHQHHRRHQRGDQQPLVAVLLDDVEYDRDEGGGGPADLNASRRERERETRRRSRWRGPVPASCLSRSRAPSQSAGRRWPCSAPPPHRA